MGTPPARPAWAVTITFHGHYGSSDWTPASTHEYTCGFFSSLPGGTVVEMAHAEGDTQPCAHGYYGGAADVEHSLGNKPSTPLWIC